MIYTVDIVYEKFRNRLLDLREMRILWQEVMLPQAESIF